MLSWSAGTTGLNLSYADRVAVTSMFASVDIRLPTDSRQPLPERSHPVPSDHRSDEQPLGLR